MKRIDEGVNAPMILKNPKLKFIILNLIVLQLLMTIVSFFAYIWLGFIMLFILVLILILYWKFYVDISGEIQSYILNLSYKIKRGEQEALIKMPIGILMYNEDEEIEWLNPYMQSQLKVEGSNSVLGKPIEEVHESLYEKIRSEDENEIDLLEWNNRIYEITLQKEIRAIYLLDVSDYAKKKHEYESAQPVLGWMFLDNYDEITNDLDDRGVLGFDSLLTTYFSNWGRQHGIFYKKISADRYFILMSKKELERLESEKFNIIDTIRDRTSKRNLPLTISIGLSYGEESYDEIANYAQQNLDLALGRGGDQAIVKEVGKEPRYYGGKTNPMEKRTRVRSRMISQALQEQISEANNIFVMGHKNPDLDAIGSSLGIARIAMMLQKKCHVVIDSDNIPRDVNKLLVEVKKHKQIYDNIISVSDAENEISEGDLVILVDHHNPNMSIAPKLLDKTSKNVIIDHHRRSGAFVYKPLLFYIEPYASSTAELITELFEYVSSDGESIKRIEATAMLGGIIVDTNNFSLRTGSRTFDAASYLQSVGADSTMIQRILKEDPEVYLQKAELISTLKFAKDTIAIAVGDDDKEYNPVTAAQTADTMLSMSGIEASFVITRRSSDTVGISARSLGDINVQLIMEQMGGGGHLSNAATQIKDATVNEVEEQLKEVINS